MRLLRERNLSVPSTSSRKSLGRKDLRTRSQCAIRIQSEFYIIMNLRQEKLPRVRSPSLEDDEPLEQGIERLMRYKMGTEPISDSASNGLLLFSSKTNKRSVKKKLDISGE